MPANVESMFYVRVAPWHGLGVRVETALSSEEALEQSGLNWRIEQQPIYTESGHLIPNYKANIRDSDNSILGVVTDRYTVVQNVDAFEFTDNLLGEGVKYETAGSLNGGRRVWLLAKLPDKYFINGDELTPYLVFSNSHDGSAAITVAMTPIRIVCQNTLNLALRGTKRSWSAKHVGNIGNKLHEAQETLQLARTYMTGLGREINELSKLKLTDSKVMEYIEMLMPMDDNPTEIHKKNIARIREDLKMRYFEAPDLKQVNKSAYRFVCAVSDFATHAKPLRETANYRENVFAKTIEGNPLIDKAYEIVLAA